MLRYTNPDKIIESIKSRQLGANIQEVSASQPIVSRRRPKDTEETDDPVKSNEQMIMEYLEMVGLSAEPPEMEEEQTRPVSRGDAGFEPLVGANLDDIEAAREALAAVESRGSGDYQAIGPVVKKGMYKGQRAYGRYQVMEGNIGPWTEKYLGQRMTTEEFMNNPEAQDRVVEAKLKESYEKFGTFEDAASVWFSGQPYEKAKGRSDDYTSVPEYVSKFRKFFNQYKEGAA